MKFKVDQIIKVLKGKGHPVFEDDSKPFNLNLVGIRTLDNTVNVFNDWMVVFWKYQGKWTLRFFPCTTDPGLYWLQNPQSKLGTAIVKEGHYKGLWHIGMHQGKYKALTQKSDVIVIRDFDHDTQLDYDSGRTERGIFGINCHRANENGKSVSVDKWSAGCQVLQNKQIFNPDNQAVRVYEFDYFMNLCEKSKENWGDSFSYSLINEKDFV